MEIPVRMPQTRTPPPTWESPLGLICLVLSTSKFRIVEARAYAVRNVEPASTDRKPLLDYRRDRSCEKELEPTDLP